MHQWSILWIKTEIKSLAGHFNIVDFLQKLLAFFWIWIFFLIINYFSNFQNPSPSFILFCNFLKDIDFITSSLRRRPYSPYTQSIQLESKNLFRWFQHPSFTYIYELQIVILLWFYMQFTMDVRNNFLCKLFHTWRECSIRTKVRFIKRLTRLNLIS